MAPGLGRSGPEVTHPPSGNTLPKPHRRPRRDTFCVPQATAGTLPTQLSPRQDRRMPRPPGPSRQGRASPCSPWEATLRPWGHWGAHPRVGVEAMQDLPAPVLVLAVAREAVQVEQALHGLGPQQVVSVGRLGRHMGSGGASQHSPLAPALGPARLTLTWTSFTAFVWCRLKCAISGLSPVSI